MISEQSEAPVSTGSLFRLRFSFAEHPWRISAAWSVLAAFVAMGMPSGAASAGMGPTAGAWYLSPIARLIICVLLADGAWGMIRHSLDAQFGDRAPSLTYRPSPVRLPYAQPASPLARLQSILSRSSAGNGQDGTALQNLIAGVVLAFALAAWLGIPALVLSLVVLMVAWWTGALIRGGRNPALAHALLDVGFPWLLAVTVIVPGVAAWRPSATAGGFAVAGSVLLLTWTIGRLGQDNALNRAIALVVHFGALALLWVAGLRVATIGIAIALAIPTVQLLRSRQETVHVRLIPWPLLVMFLGAVLARVN